MLVVAQKTTFTEHIISLEFVTTFFSWLFMLLTRLSEPFLMLATIYIICETAVPSLHSAAWENTALAIMVTAPEFVLPGSFVVARQAKQRNKPLAGWLKAICIAFLVLMALTLADVLIFHLVGYWLAGLMFVRCSVAVGYSILMRVMQHGAKPVIVEPKKEEVTQAKQETKPAPIMQISIAKRRLNGIEKASFSGFVSMCSETFIEPPKREVKEALNPEGNTSFNERNTDELTIVKTDDNSLIKAYPNIQSWLDTGRKTVTIEDIIEATGISRKMVSNRLKDGTLKPSGRNPNLIRTATVIEWLTPELKAS